MGDNLNSVRIEPDGSLTALSRQILAIKIKDDIDAFCVKLYADEPRRHLGASVIGDECSRRVWYLFRWYSFEQFSARMLRLFNRGHREEARFIEWLRGIGFNVLDADPASGDQWRIKAVAGHFGGSLDGIAQAPYAILQSMPFLLEFKTHNDKSFENLKKNGVQKSKPRHFKQMCTYGRAYGYRYGIYCAIDKDNDDLHIEVVELNWSLGDDMFMRADEIIRTQIPPRRIAENPTFEACKRCFLQAQCFSGAPPEKNCRSCVNAVPVENGEWYCNRHCGNIPTTFIPHGCGDWRALT